MKYLIASILMGLGAIGVVVGKWGTIISAIAWVVGLIGVIPYITFWWVPLFITVFALGLIFASAGAVIAK